MENRDFDTADSVDRLEVSSGLLALESIGIDDEDDAFFDPNPNAKLNPNTGNLVSSQNLTSA